jgi:type IV pilus assembly protein PilC
MPIYTWKGRTRQGALKKGEIEAANEAAVMAQLRAQSLLPVTVKEKPKDVSEYLTFLKQGIKTRDLVIFTRQFATMIDAGLPLVQCLDILADQEPNKTFKAIIRDVRTDVEQGATFADSLRKHPKPFDALYVNLVQAGEIGGILDTILNRLAVYLEKADALARKVKGAMVYPTTVLVVAIGVVILMLVKVIPVFEKMFEDFGGELPGPTQVVVNLSHFMQEWIVVFLVCVAAVFIAFFQARKKSLKFRRSTDALFLKLPIFGPLLQKVAVARFTRTLGTMIASGVPILDGLDIVAKTAGNVVIGQDDLGTTAGVGGLPRHGHADDRGGRGNRCDGDHAEQDRGLLRRGGRHCGRRPDVTARAGHDGRPGRIDWRPVDRNVPADLQDCGDDRLEAPACHPRAARPLVRFASRELRSVSSAT